MNKLVSALTTRPGRSLVKTGPVVDIHGIASSATTSLLLELETWPKPGLVSHIDNGSHQDMCADTFRVSAKALHPYFEALVAAGAGGCQMGRLRVIGIEAEKAMMEATNGVNTHRGAIFGMGLLCAAAGARAGSQVASNLSLGAIASQLWATDIMGGPIVLHSHGSKVRRRYGAGGARDEAAHGFPTLYNIGLTALRRANSLRPSDPEAARVQICFSLIAKLEDTNVLHRGGARGLRFARSKAQEFLAEGGIASPIWRARASAIHQAFVERRLSPGGSADLLAMTLFVDEQERLLA